MSGCLEVFSVAWVTVWTGDDYKVFGSGTRLIVTGMCTYCSFSSTDLIKEVFIKLYWVPLGSTTKL